MIVRLGTAPRRAGLDFEGFQQHWRTSHADVVSHLPRLRRYQQFHAVLETGRPLLDYPGFDACSALEFDSAEAMDQAFDSAEFRDAVTNDEAEFVDKTRFRGIVGAWRPDASVALGEGGPVQVLTLLRAAPGESPEELAERLAASSDDPSRAGSIVADHSLHDGRFPVTADVVRVVGFDDAAAAIQGAAATRQHVGTADIIGEHLAHVVDVPLSNGAPATRHNERTDA